MSVSTIILAALATYRLTRLVMLEDGPFSLALKLRGMLDPDQHTWIGRGMACPWCISFWLGPLTVYVATYQAGAILIAGLAVSALVGLAVQCSGYLLAYLERLLTIPTFEAGPFPAWHTWSSLSNGRGKCAAQRRRHARRCQHDKRKRAMVKQSRRTNR